MKTKGMGIALLSAAALLGSAVAQAELPWTYVEAGYTKADGSEFADTDALDIKGSIGFANVWHASLDYQDGTTDFDIGPDSDFDGWRFVVGAHPQLTPNTQLVADLTYFNYDFDGGEGSDGFGVGLGLRHSLTDKVELLAEAWYTQTSVDDNSSNPDFDVYNTTVQLGGRYKWTPNFSTGLTVDLGGSGSSSGFFGGDQARFDIRWSFADIVSK
ncbi:MAG: hypothetical protein JNK40_14215 [Chromatiales bacterium]|nr:hypothetical protein [Chromatiales bacterium]